MTKMSAFATATSLVLLFALTATVQGFSVLTMSSYLDQLGKAAPISSSYSYGSSSSPSPASYTTPSPAASYTYAPAAPAPAPVYVSGFANRPANKDLNYVKTLGGGSAKKWGTDFSGVSSSFRAIYSATSSNGAYLDNLKGAVMTRSSDYSAPAPAPAAASYSYANSWNPTPAPAPAASYSYGGGVPAAPAPAPYVSSFAPSPNSGSSAPKTSSSYLSSL